ncbi:MAG TPA: C1 family peptidase [Bacteroidales bacterium]|nr:C1 family peptidase [Bacteroidales bacterium]HSA44738.1 C1 family peptidase [Bacteroidales bacterium]
MKKVILIITCAVLMLNPTQAQNQDKAVFKFYGEGYYDKYILSGIRDFEQAQKSEPEKKPVFKVDMSTLKVPSDRKTYTTYWHNEPVSQGATNTCWCFSGTSFLESEIYRLTKRRIKLSEMHTVYYEYIERAVYFVEHRGDMAVGEGSECNAVTKIWKKYGIVPYEDYTGLLPGQVYYDHQQLFEEVDRFFKHVKSENIWNETFVVSTVKDILQFYMGEPPQKISFEGKTYSPVQFLQEILKVNPDDFVDVLSYLQQPFWKKVEYEVPDNWWHSKDYHNLPLEDYMKIIKKALREGYTVAIGGDVSEAGFDARDFQAAIVPTFDIPPAFINDDARQFRFTNKTTTDDHGMHIVGYIEKEGVTWFLVKDSGSGSRTGGKENNPNFGYYFFREDFVKLKMMDFMVHKDMLKEYLPKFN